MLKIVFLNSPRLSLLSEDLPNFELSYSEFVNLLFSFTKHCFVKQQLFFLSVTGWQIVCLNQNDSFSILEAYLKSLQNTFSQVYANRLSFFPSCEPFYIFCWERLMPFVEGVKTLSKPLLIKDRQLSISTITRRTCPSSLKSNWIITIIWLSHFGIADLVRS